MASAETQFSLSRIAFTSANTCKTERLECMKTSISHILFFLWAGKEIAALHHLLLNSFYIILDKVQQTKLDDIKHFLQQVLPHNGVESIKQQVNRVETTQDGSIW